MQVHIRCKHTSPTCQARMCVCVFLSVCLSVCVCARACVCLCVVCASVCWYQPPLPNAPRLIAFTRQSSAAVRYSGKLFYIGTYHLYHPRVEGVSCEQELSIIMGGLELTPPQPDSRQEGNMMNACRQPIIPVDGCKGAGSRPNATGSCAHKWCASP